MNLKSLKIGNLEAKLPIVQGGMGIGVSLSNLASAVARCGGIGIISAAQIGFKEKDFRKDTLSANIRALKFHIKAALKKAGNGIIGVNIMCASKNYTELVQCSIEAGAQIIMSGAGLPINLPELCKNSDIKMVPIISSRKASSVILRLWSKKYDIVPDAIVLEGPEAGGHLGFKSENIENAKKSFYNEIKEVLLEIKFFEEKYNKNIPLIVGGGIYDGYDISKVMSLGASGVQIGTRFVATEECDAHINYKLAYVNAKKEDIKIIASPVGMPGRALFNNFVKLSEEGPIKVKKCFKCLSHCNPATTPYCITDALINAVEGDIANGLIFCGTNGYKINKIVSVRELINELLKEVKEFKNND
ncbi:NAD(P)H-dependent flavin oxidoreductase [Hathewaya histolytica]|uniref:NAD(P)H-dependent flavin oxidoreductase n=1 Tax=Hathewaya histolytica TaxID=1498 RepID=UPI003B6720FA